MAGNGELAEVRFDRLVDSLRVQFAESGACVAQAAEVHDTKQWRRAARLAAHRLGLFVATGHFGPADELVWAKTYDRPTTDADRREAMIIIEHAVFATASMEGLPGAE